MKTLKVDDFLEILDSTPGYVAVHRPILDSSGDLTDLELVWFNAAYRKLFVIPPSVGQRMLDTYHEPEIALDFARGAIEEKRVHQYFSIERPALEGYLRFDRPTVLSVEWVRVGKFVVETGEDVTHLQEVETQLYQSDLELLEAWKRQEVAESREQIARDMHDSVIQRLLAVGMGIRQTLGVGKVGAENLRLAEVVTRNLDQAIHELRSIVETLTSRETNVVPSTELDQELLEILESMSLLLGHLPGYSFKISCPLDGATRHDIGSVVREALSNVAKHASASRTFVRVACDRSNLQVVVLDDGIGFATDAPPGHGLDNLKQRALRRGGHMKIGQRSERSGTRLVWSIPCPDAVSRTPSST